MIEIYIVSSTKLNKDLMDFSMDLDRKINQVRAWNKLSKKNEIVLKFFGDRLGAAMLQAIAQDTMAAQNINRIDWKIVDGKCRCCADILEMGYCHNCDGYSDLPLLIYRPNSKCERHQNVPTKENTIKSSKSG